jgi:hypothetical protein
MVNLDGVGHRLTITVNMSFWHLLTILNESTYTFAAIAYSSHLQVFEFF